MALLLLIVVSVTFCGRASSFDGDPAERRGPGDGVVRLTVACEIKAHFSMALGWSGPISSRREQVRRLLSSVFFSFFDFYNISIFFVPAATTAAAASFFQLFLFIRSLTMFFPLFCASF